MYYSGPIQFLLWDSDLHLSKSHLTALLRAGVRSHIIHFAISRKTVRYMSDIKHFISWSLPELLTSPLSEKKLTPASREHVHVNQSQISERSVRCELCNEGCAAAETESWDVPAASFPPAKASRRSSRCRERAEVPERYCGSPRHPCWRSVMKNNNDPQELCLFCWLSETSASTFFHISP